MCRDPSRRYADAREAWHALLAEPSAPSWLDRARRARPRRFGAWLAAALAIAVASAWALRTPPRFPTLGAQVVAAPATIEREAAASAPPEASAALVSASASASAAASARATATSAPRRPRSRPFDSAEAMSAIAQSMVGVSACHQAGGPKVLSGVVTFTPAGSVDAVSFFDPAATGTPAALCVAGRLMRMKITPYDGEREPLPFSAIISP